MREKNTIAFVLVGSLTLLSLSSNFIVVKQCALPSSSPMPRDILNVLAESPNLRTASNIHTIRSPRYEREHYRTNTASLHKCRIGNETVTIPTAPSFIILGTQKSGTTFLLQHLNMHPNIVPSKRKENHFFHLTELKELARDEDYCHVRKLYVEKHHDIEDLVERIKKGTRNLMTFDKTPSYLHSKNAPDHVYRTCLWPVKIVAVLRNPVDRAYSQYWMAHSQDSFEAVMNGELKLMHRNGLSNFPFFPQDTATQPTRMVEPNFASDLDDAFLDSVNTIPPRESSILHKGIYAPQLRNWMKRFPHPDPLLVLNYDDLKKDSKAVYHRILEHVGLPPYDPPEGFEEVFVGKYQHKPMANSTKRRLEEFFEPYNAELVGLLGKEWKGVWTSPTVD